MNNGFNFESQNFDDKKHKKVFSLLALSVFTYLLVANLLSYLFALALKTYEWNLSNDIKYIIAIFIQYGIAFPISYLLIKNLEASEPAKTSLKPFAFFKYVCVAIAFMYVGSLVSTNLLNIITNIFGDVSSDPLSDTLNGMSLWLSFAFVCILGPIVEEFIFRKLLIDRLSPYGDKISILFSALLFSLHHTNVYQFIYAFLFGIILAYIYRKTGRLLYTVIIHGLANFLMGFLPLILEKTVDINKLINAVLGETVDYEFIYDNILSMFLYALYSQIYMAIVILGIIFLFLNRKKIVLKKGDVLLPKDSYLNVMFFNVGTVIFIVSTLVYSFIYLVI